jgi:hypothetical protein
MDRDMPKVTMPSRSAAPAGAALQPSGEGLKLPADYDAIFADRVTIITGVGRSGTTILGKIVGSFASTYYLYEPVTLRLLSALMNQPRLSSTLASAMKAILFEDFFLQQLQGRNINPNPADDSFTGNYSTKRDVAARWRRRRRSEVIEFLWANPARFVMKIPEFQPLMTVARETFPGARFLHIIRNGNDVISSALVRGWYSDASLSQEFAEWMHAGDGSQVGVPWFVTGEDRKQFPRWNAATRTACVWRTLTEAGRAFCRANPRESMEFRYEDFAKDPASFVKRIEVFLAATSTAITRKHVRGVTQHRGAGYADLRETIDQPERAKYQRLLTALGY